MTADLRSLATLTPNPDWASLPLFDRRAWKRVRFGDVVKNCNETCDPTEEDVERFVAMEHLEPGSLHVRAWGNVVDGTTFTRRCGPGQVLFGKRRAYQRKVALAEFDAVVSGDIYVLAPKDKRLLPELLPFLCLSERFFDHAVGTSAGSLSPRTNWSSLASFEFDLPPPDQQRRIAEVLWAADDGVQKSSRLLSSIEATFNAIFRESQRGSIQPERLDSFTLLITDGDHNPPRRTQSGIPHVLVQNVRNGRVDLTDCTFISPEDYMRVRKRYIPIKGDILVVCVGATIGRAGLVGDQVEFSTDRSLAVIRFDESRVLPEFGFALVCSEMFQSQVTRNSVGTAQPHLFLGDIRRIKVRIPVIEEQRKTVIRLNELTDMLGAAALNESRLRAVLENLSSPVF